MLTSCASANKRGRPPTFPPAAEFEKDRDMAKKAQLKLLSGDEE
jgi:rRNA maturation protein Nop10